MKGKGGKEGGSTAGQEEKGEEGVGDEKEKDWRKDLGRNRDTPRFFWIDATVKQFSL